MEKRADKYLKNYTHKAVAQDYSGAVSLCGDDRSSVDGKTVYGGAKRTKDDKKVTCPDCLAFINKEVKLSDLKTALEVSSEKFFKMVPQPKDTCPLIDEAMENIKKEITNLTKFNQLSTEFNYPLDFEEEDEDFDDEDLDSVVDKVTQAGLDALDILDLLKSDLANLEKYREECEDYRGSLNTFKQELWSILDRLVILEGNYLPHKYSFSEEGKNLLENLAIPKVATVQVSLLSHKWSLRIEELNSLLSIELSGKDLNFKEELEKMKKLIPTELSEKNSQVVLEALDNFDKMNEWHKSFISLVNSLKTGTIEYL